MKISVLVGFFWAIALIIAGVFAVTTSTLPQSVPLIITCFASVFAFAGLRKKKLKHVHPIIWLFLAAWVYFITRAFLSPVSHLARQDLFLLIPAGIIYLTNAFLLPSRKLRGMLVGGVLLLMVLNLLQLIPAVNAFRDTTFEYAQGSTGLVNGEKFTGLYNHQNFFSNFMGMATIISLSLAIWGNFSKLPRILLFTLSVAGIAAIGLAQSRGGYLGIIGGGAVVGMMSLVLMRSDQSKGQIITKISLVLIAGIVVLVGGYKVLEERESQATNDKLGKFQSSGRLGMFASVIDQVPDAPLLGSGSRSIEYTSYQTWPKTNYNSGIDHIYAHNEYLQALGDYGIIGLFFVLALIIWHLVLGMKQILWLRSHAPHSRSLAYCVAGLSILVLMALHTTVSFPTHSMSNIMLFALACTFVLPRHSEKRETSATALNYKLACALSSLALLFSIAYAATQGTKELRAGMVFWKNGIAVDDRNWGPTFQQGDWIPALEEAVEISPNYRRYSLLGTLYLNHSTTLDADTQPLEKQTYLKKAEQALLASKALHNEWPNTRINLAVTYNELGEFEKASKEFAEVEHMVEKREEVFSYYRIRADLYFAWARNALEKGELEKAHQLSKKASKFAEISLKKMLGRMDKKLQGVLYGSYLVGYDAMRIKENETPQKLDKSLTTFDAYARSCRRYQYWNDADYTAEFGEIAFNHAVLVIEQLNKKEITFKRSERFAMNQRAADVFHLSLKALYHAKSLKGGSAGAKLNNLIEKAEKAVKYYQSIRVSPNKNYPFSEDDE